MSQQAFSIHTQSKYSPIPTRSLNEIKYKRPCPHSLHTPSDALFNTCFKWLAVVYRNCQERLLLIQFSFILGTGQHQLVCIRCISLSWQFIFTIISGKNINWITRFRFTVLRYLTFHFMQLYPPVPLHLFAKLGC